MIFSADIEDWQQSVLDYKRPVSRRVVENTERLLDLLAERHVKGTFFIQGLVAERWPQLVQTIARNGHEIASHAYSHRPLYHLSPAEVQTEIERSTYLLEDLSGTKVIGFRAPSFSLQHTMLDWYCEALHRVGIVYDSSLMLAQVRKLYGTVDESTLAGLQQRGIHSYPLTTATVLGHKIPVLGGGYFRIYPYALTSWLIRNLDHQTSIFYMHPYELDVQEYDEVAKPAGISKRWAIHQFAGRQQQIKKLRRLLNDYIFTSFRQQYYN